jgi:hypothetical protein
MQLRVRIALHPVPLQLTQTGGSAPALPPDRL